MCQSILIKYFEPLFLFVIGVILLNLFILLPVFYSLVPSGLLYGIELYQFL